MSRESIRGSVAASVAFLFAVHAFAVPSDASGPPRGSVVERVAAGGLPEQSYALYLPTRYDPARKWPIVYVLDARGNALEPMERLRAAAEEYGYVVASSWNSHSDGPLAPNVTAIRAMWADTHKRVSIDDRRIYVAGFSGTARAAVILAHRAPGTIAGIVAAGAGYPEDSAPSEKDTFALFAGVGSRDFNYREIHELEPKLVAAGVTHRITVFDGGHEWMPAGVFREALAFFDLAAMRLGARDRDERLIAAAWSEDAARAPQLPPLESWRLWRAMSRDYAGLKDTSEASRRAAALAARDDVRALENKQKAELEAEQRALDEARRILTTAATPRSAIRDLHIAELQKRTDLVAARILNTLRGQTAFYLPREMAARGDHKRAAFFLTIATAIDPENATLAYRLAASRARAGEHAAAIEDLRRAITLGFKDGARLDADEAFASLRDVPGFRKLANALR